MFLLNTKSILQHHIHDLLKIKESSVESLKGSVTCLVESLKKNNVYSGESVKKNNIVKILFYNAA